MPTLKVNYRKNIDLNALVAERTRTFLDGEIKARRQGATTATVKSRSGFTYKRDIAPVRAGRSGTGGQMRSFINWRATADGQVGLDTDMLRQRAPHWIIQEIGTGESAVVRRGGTPNPTGRPARGAKYTRTIRSQVGRRIRPGLVFATKGGTYSPTGSARGEQIYPYSTVGAPRAPAIVIRREIEGQHFIRKGGTQGFRQYRTSALAAARSAFVRKGPR